MNQLFLGLVLLSAGLVHSSAFAFEIEIEQEGGSNGGGGSGSGTGTGTGSTAPTGPNSGVSGSSSGPIKIACLDSSGAVKNANPEEVCKAVLPKCADLKRSVQDKVKDMLHMKIVGYYKGKDVDLARSTLTNLVGVDMPYRPCSVVGHTLSGNGNDAEITGQTIHARASCGSAPEFKFDFDGRKLSIHYEGVQGTMWISWMLGAYPWLIRKHAAAVLFAIQDDLSNVDALLQSSRAMSSDLSRTQQQMRDFTRTLGAQARQSCGAPNSNLIRDCTSGALSINDPAQRACTIVKAQLAANEGALPNMLAFEIMARVQREYDSTIARVASFSDPIADGMKKACAKTSGGFLSFRGKKKKAAMSASCLAGRLHCCVDSGEMNDHSVSSAGVCEDMPRKISLSNGSVTSSFSLGGITLPGMGGGATTRNKGMAAVIEYLIRKSCGQTSLNQVTDCDRIDIKSAE